MPCEGLTRHTDFRCQSLKLKTSFVDSPESSLERWNVSSLCFFAIVRKDWEFGVDCNTRSRWCGQKQSLSVCILNASQSKSNPVCATLVCGLIFPPPGSAKRCYSNEKRLNPVTGKTCLMWKHTSYSIPAITYTQLVILDLIMRLIPLCMWGITSSLCNAEEQNVGITQEVV